MKAETVEKIYHELNARGFINEERVALMSRGVGFEEIAQTLSVGEPMSLAEAIEKIRNAESLKDRHRTIDMEVVIHDSTVDVSFGVWAGNRDYKGATLEGAVNSCLVHNNEFSGTEEEAERVVSEALENAARH